MASTTSHYKLFHRHLNIDRNHTETANDFGVPTRQSQCHLLTNFFKEEDNFEENKKEKKTNKLGSDISFNFM